MHMTPSQAIRAMAEKALAEPAPQTPDAQDLPYVARRILRLLTGENMQRAALHVLRRKIGEEGDLTPALLTLVRYRLVTPVERSYCITDAGIDCITTVVPRKDLARTP